MEFDTSEMVKKWKDEAKQSRERWNEVELGKRKLFVVKSANGISVYPEGDETLEFIVRGRNEEFIRRGFLKEMNGQDTARYLHLRKKHIAYGKRMNDLVRKILRW